MPPIPAPTEMCLVVGFNETIPGVTAANAAQVFITPAPADLGTAAQVAFDAGFPRAIVVKVPNYYTKPA